MFERRAKATSAQTVGPKIDDHGFEVVAFLAEQRLAATPVNYELGYRYRTDRDGALARAVDAVLMAGERLTQSLADQIRAAHARPPAESEADRMIRFQARQLAELTADALATTGQFGRDLGGLDAGSDGGAATATLVTTMLAYSRAAETALEKASLEIETLRHEVEAAKGDAARDALTGLHNRRGVEAQVRTLAAREHSALAICDIDFFKLVNDRYGHVVGDRVLQLVASSLAKSCEPHLVARWGGEEFIILINGAGVDEAADIVNRARNDLASRNVRLRTTDEPMGPITFSAGVVGLRGKMFNDAVGEADRLLYRAKANGRNRVVQQEPTEQDRRSRD